MKCIAGRTNPELWKRAKAKAKAEACRSGSRRCGSWDARMAQRAGAIYREAGGDYCGTKTAPQKAISKWTHEDWRTVTGDAACARVRGRIVCDRYLPAKAWKALTPAQQAATRRKKKAARGQFAPNTKAAKTAGKKARR
jgi:hypothetical protein